MSGITATTSKSGGVGFSNLLQKATKRNFFGGGKNRKGSVRKQKNKKNKSGNSAGAIAESVTQPTIYGGHINGGGSVSKRRASQKRRRRLSNAKKSSQSQQDLKNKLLTKADIGQPMPMNEDEKKNVIAAKHWPLGLNSSTTAKPLSAGNTY